MEESFSNGWKTLWEKKKLLVTSNFIFSHSVFKRLVLQTRKNQGLFGKGIALYQTTKFWSPLNSAYADSKPNIPNMIISVFDKGEKIVGKK